MRRYLSSVLAVYVLVIGLLNAVTLYLARNYSTLENVQASLLAPFLAGFVMAAIIRRNDPQASRRTRLIAGGLVGVMNMVSIVLDGGLSSGLQTAFLPLLNFAGFQFIVGAMGAALSDEIRVFSYGVLGATAAIIVILLPIPKPLDGLLAGVAVPAVTGFLLVRHRLRQGREGEAQALYATAAGVILALIVGMLLPSIVQALPCEPANPWHDACYEEYIGNIFYMHDYALSLLAYPALGMALGALGGVLAGWFTRGRIKRKQPDYNYTTA